MTRRRKRRNAPPGAVTPVLGPAETPPENGDWSAISPRRPSAPLPLAFALQWIEIEKSHDREAEEASWRATWEADLSASPLGSAGVQGFLAGDRNQGKASDALTGDTITDDQIRGFRRLHPDSPVILDQLMRAIHSADLELRSDARARFADAINALGRSSRQV